MDIAASIPYRRQVILRYDKILADSKTNERVGRMNFIKHLFLNCEVFYLSFSYDLLVLFLFLKKAICIGIRRLHKVTF